MHVRKIVFQLSNISVVNDILFESNCYRIAKAISKTDSGKIKSVCKQKHDIDSNNTSEIESSELHDSKAKLIANVMRSV